MRGLRPWGAGGAALVAAMMEMHDLLPRLIVVLAWVEVPLIGLVPQVRVAPPAKSKLLKMRKRKQA